MDLIKHKKSILNFNELKEISLKSSLVQSDGPFLVQRNSWSKQIVKSSDDFELNLYKQSKTIFSFRERVVIRAKTKQGLILNSEILKGEFNSFKNMKSLENEIQKLDFRIRKKSFDIDYYEIIHTHPTGCYIEAEDGHNVLSLGGLSQADYDVANHFQNKYEVRFRLKAICPGGITYCSV